MSQKNEKPESQPAAGEPQPAQQPVDNEAAQSSQPAGAARGSDLPPQGQGGPHPPAEPTGKSLAEQFESGPVLPDVPLPADPDTGEPLAMPVDKVVERLNEQLPKEPAEIEKPHKCSLCGSPDHRACGCEAKAIKKQNSLDGLDQAGNRMDQELDHEEVHVNEVLEKLFKDTLNPIASDMAISVVKTVEEFHAFQQGVLDGLGDINTNLEALVKLQKDRADLLKDIQNAKSN